MNDYVLNVWQDLRDKRLWPVAVVLALALVAVPALLLKGKPDEPSASRGSAPGADSQQLPLVGSDPTAIAGSSKLGSFGSKNPFRSPATPPDDAPAAGGTPGSVAAGGSSADASGGLAAGEGSSTGATGGIESAGDTPQPGGTGGGSSSGGSPQPRGGSGSGSTPSPSEPPEPPEPRYFTYAADVSFGPKGEEERRSLEAVAPLVSENGNVVAVYLGQTAENESVFLVNQSFRVKGERHCRSKCAFVYLRPESGQNEVTFVGRPEAGVDDAGAEYRLVLRGVRRVLDEREASSRSTSADTKRRRAKAAEARSRSPKARRRTVFDFSIPLIAGRRR